MTNFVSKLGDKTADKLATYIAAAIVAIFFIILGFAWNTILDNREAVLKVLVVVVTINNIISIVYMRILRHKQTEKTDNCQSAHIWWLCNDLWYGKTYVLNGKMVYIIGNLEQIHYHASQLNLNPALIEDIWKFRDDAVAAVDSNWSNEKRSLISTELMKIHARFSQEIQARQKDFVPDAPAKYKPS